LEPPITTEIHAGKIAPLTTEIQASKIPLRLRTAGALIFLGVLIEILTLEWNSPIAFLVFLGMGGLLIGLGVVFYLLSIVSPSMS
jgi:hypothetical protein